MKILYLLILCLSYCCADITHRDTLFNTNTNYLSENYFYVDPINCKNKCNQYNGCTHFASEKPSHAVSVEDYYKCYVFKGPITTANGKRANHCNSTILGNGSAKIKIVKHGKYLKSTGTETYKANPATVADSDFSDYQVWTVYNVNGRSMFLKNAATGLYLDANGNQVYAHSFNGGDYQEWIHENSRIMHIKSGKFLYADANGVAILTDDYYNAVVNVEYS